MSSKLRRTLPAGILTLLALGLTGAALSWACTPSAGISVSPASGGAGTVVAVNGGSFTANATVVIRWNGPSGPVLGSATASPDGAFTTSVTIPAGAPDTYTLVAVGPRGIGTASYTILGGPSPRPGQAPVSSNDASGAGSENGTSPAGARDEGGNSISADGGSGTRSDGTADRSPPADAGGLVAADNSTGTARSEDRESVFAGSGPSGPGKDAARATGTPSARSGAANLWAGFGSPASRVLAAREAPLSTGGSMPAFSVILLGLGLAAGLAGAGLASARRRARATDGTISD